MTEATEIVTGESFADARLSRQEWRGVTFEQCDFTEADLSAATTHGCRFVRCDFGRTDLGDSRHTATAFHNCTFDRVLWTRSTLDGCSLLGSTFLDCRTRPWTIRDTDLTLVGLSGANLRGT